MADKSNEQRKATGGAARYHDLYDRVSKVSALEVARLFATRDPRVQFIRSLEDGRVFSRVELNALTRLLTDHLGVEPEVWLGYLNEELEMELQRLEQDNGVSGYDGEGNPILGGTQP